MFRNILSLLLMVSVSFVEAADRPNIMLIFADDLGWKDVGYQGSDFMETPHLDRLAKQGMIFSAGYAAAGNCAPSRACLLSGTYTPRHHVYAVGSTDRGDKTQQRLVPIPNKLGLGKEHVTIAEALKSAGYSTGHFGKWHLAGKEGALPTEQGFDVSFDSTGEGEEKEGAEANKAGPPSDPKGVFTLTRKACEFIESNKENPFFCYLAHHAIHTPLQARTETLAKFEAKTPGEQHSNAMYAASTYDLDASVGILLQKLDDLGLTNNTLLVFTSDNGGTQQSSQEPLRGNKGCYYEGGIREPFIVRWPGVTQPGSHCDVPVINVDLFPTFLAAAGAEVLAGKILDGESLLPLLAGKNSLTRESIFWHFPGYLNNPVIRGRELDVRTGFRSRPVSVIHKGDWKLHLYHEEWQLDGGREKLAENNAVELYNLKNDIGERTNLAQKNTGMRDDLLADLLAWQQSTNALIPSKPNSEYQSTAIQSDEKRPATTNLFLGSGVKVGEITDQTAIVLVRLTATAGQDDDGLIPGKEGQARILYGTDPALREFRTTDWNTAMVEADHSIQFRLRELIPKQRQFYKVEYRSSESAKPDLSKVFSFVTAPAADHRAAVKFHLTTCQDTRGKSIYKVMTEQHPDFCVSAGDTVYYDGEGLARDVPHAWQAYQKMFGLPTMKAYYENVGGYFMKDDHDYRFNDADPWMKGKWISATSRKIDPGAKFTETKGDLRLDSAWLTHEEGIRVFKQVFPMGDKTHRTVRWGNGLQIWMLENRDFRSPNDMPDGPDKTIWGPEQKAWLLESLRASDADYRIVISPNPIVGPDRASKGDNHANKKGFWHEGQQFLDSLKDMQLNNVILMCGDRHWQYHSHDRRNGRDIHEFSCGATCDEHTQPVPPLYEGVEQPYSASRGGFMQVHYQPDDRSATFEFYSVTGQLLYQKVFK